MIEKAMKECHIAVKPNKNAKQQGIAHAKLHIMYCKSFMLANVMLALYLSTI